MSAYSELYRLLEFDKILSLIRQQTDMPQTRDRLEALPCSTSIANISDALRKVSELRNILEHEPVFPLELVDIEDTLKTAGVAGTVLSCQALTAVVSILGTSRKIQAYLRDRKNSYPTLWQVARGLSSFKEIERQVSDKINLQTKEVLSSASQKLGHLRKEMGRVEQKTRQQIEKLFGVYSGKGYLQESVISLKEGRLVFPVKAEHRGRIKGLMHDQSATGATVFIEPIESIELNNSLMNLRQEERREIEKILQQLTAFIHNDHEGISSNFSLLLEFDFILAKARFARRFDCHPPSLNDHGELAIVNGRHPLLLQHKDKQSDVIPLDLEAGSDLKTLVISGPNAGGKSVVLKTVGLFSLMVQSGIPIPAHPDTAIPVFDLFFADIGDLQSIENDLSTFTSHVKNLRHILENSNEKSLVLLDEIGASTDPDEGAALAIAVLSALTDRGCKTVVTTHHGRLKAFAFNTPGVENASMEFDVHTLQPTYRFKLGLPGSSYALEISRRMGFPDEIIAEARQLLGSEKNKLESLILELEKQIQASRTHSNELALDKLRLEGLTRLYSEKMDSFKKEQNQLKKQALLQSREVLEKANRLIELTVKEIREGQANRETVAKAKETIRQQAITLERRVERLQEQMPTKPPEESIVEPAVGSDACWKSQKKVGTIIAMRTDAKKVLLQLGNLKVWVPEADLAPAPVTSKPDKSVRGITIQTSAKDDILPEIDVRGCVLDEARTTVDKFLDDAILAGWEQVSIIHGKGTGALRKGLAKYLSEHSHVKKHQMGAWNEGDLGVTVVDLE